LQLLRNKTIWILCYFILIILNEIIMMWRIFKIKLNRILNFFTHGNIGFLISRLIIDFHSILIIQIEIILFVNWKVLRHYEIIIVSQISFWTIFFFIIILRYEIALYILSLLLLMDLILNLVYVCKILILKI
jgi:hypothetical protein